MKGTAAGNAAELPVHRVDVVEPGGAARRRHIRCEIGKNLKFDTAGLEAYCFANWDARVFDAFVLAAAIQFCDHTKARPSARWGREIILRVPVHDPAHWRSAAVSGALHRALEFLTGDRWHIEFVARTRPEVPPRQQNLSLPDGERVVIPFSDGLDSRAVGGLAEREHGNKLIRVRLGSRSLNGHPTEGERLPFASVPYHVRIDRRGSVEPSARSRGFKFALLSGIAAYLSQAWKVIVPESGQGALGPVLVPVGQAYEDYRNHPLFTDRMEAFLSALLGHDIRYIYPRLWHTKAETLAAFAAECPDGKNWALTRSCWQGQRQVSLFGKWRQCGICAACMLRRMSVHAMGGTEEKATYIWEDLSAVRYEDGAAAGFRRSKPQGALYEYAIAGTLHLDHLAGLQHSPANQPLLDRQVFQLSRSLGVAELKTQQKLERLLTQHAGEWKDFVGSLGPHSFVAQWALGGP
ncbi:MAG: 7-cyano-7-deazaguanine synthase [Rhodospirillales bacterium]|nr:7-cyano-7-deazaguanine synthase [Rhodospirillales bacterium]